MDHVHVFGDIEANGQTWNVRWYPPPDVPAGKRHGAAGICVTPHGEIVLISNDGLSWDLPAGRPEGDEDWRDTLRREMREEACVTVVEDRLLGFCASRCVKGAEAGLVLVRSFWLAQVHVDAWEPQFEIAHRRIVAAGDVLALLPPPFAPVNRHAFALAHLVGWHTTGTK